MAPEVLMGRQYVGAMSDIFSLGVCLYIMVTCSMPFVESATEKDKMYKYIFLGYD